MFKRNFDDIEPEAEVTEEFQPTLSTLLDAIATKGVQELDLRKAYLDESCLQCLSE